MMNKGVESGKEFPDGIDMWWGILVAAQVNNHPGNVPQEANRYSFRNKVQKDGHDSQTDDVVAQVRPITDDIAQRPDGLFANVGVRRVEQH